MAKRSEKRGQILERPDGMLGPDLPAGPTILKNGRDWKPIVRKWYDDFRKSPNASLVCTMPMWMGVIIAFAELDEMLVTGRYSSIGPEVRQMFSDYGWTPASLRKLKFDDVEPEDYSASNGSSSNRVVDLSEYKRRRRAAGG